MAFVNLTLVTFAVLYAAAVSGMFLLQRDLQYFPSRRNPAPDELGLAGVQRTSLTTSDGETLVLWFAPPATGRPVILFLHGNAGSIADRADRMAFYQSRGFGAAFLSFRGYGGSTGRPSETGLIRDAEAALRFLRAAAVPDRRIAVVGESLGTGVAVQIAARHRIGALVLEAPFTAAVDIAARAYPWLPVRHLMRDQFRSRSVIGEVRAPLLILHGEADSVIPFAFGQGLFALGNDPKTFLSLGPVGHEALGDPATWAMGADFIDRAVPP